MAQANIKYVYSEELIKTADKNPAVKGRASLVHELIRSYGLLKHLQILQPVKCKFTDLKRFHDSDYIEFLITNSKKYAKTTEPSLDGESSNSSNDESLDSTIAEEYGLGFDCPVWRNLGEYACSISGATMSACYALCKSKSKGKPSEIIISWTGGWHHAHRDKAAGYCYINDIVLGILMLRKVFKRIIYIDLDVHHGDGVQGAFETSKRVFTLSLHRYESGFYPGTGSAKDCGVGEGKGYAANFPYQSGITGDNFKPYFQRILSDIFQCYQPDVCIVQCGADVIVGDPLGCTNLTPDDLIECVQSILYHKLPTILLGGGGYNFTNTSRYWTKLTAMVCRKTIPDDIPEDNERFLEYGPDYSICIERRPSMVDMNSVAMLEESAATIKENLMKYNVHAV